MADARTSGRGKLGRVQALRSERDAIVDFCERLSAEEWAQPSRCEGWTVQDTVAHMAAAYHGTFGPWVVKLMLSKDIEADNDRDANKRRDRSPDQVLSEYTRWSKRFLAIGGSLQHPPLSALPIRLAEVGTYPAWMLASALTFDHHVHLRYDIATALERPTRPAADGVLTVVLEWMWAGLPGMSRTTLAWLDRNVTVSLSGDEGGVWSVVPGKSGGRVKVVDGALDDAAARIVAGAEEFPVWGTRRQPWRDAGVDVAGDVELGERFLDTMRII